MDVIKWGGWGGGGGWLHKCGLSFSFLERVCKCGRGAKKCAGIVRGAGYGLFSIGRERERERLPMYV